MNSPREQHPVSNLSQIRIPGQPIEAHPGAPNQHGYEVELKAWFAVLSDSRWLIAGVTLWATVFALAYALLATPVYQANMTVQVDEDRPSGSSNILSETSSLFETKKAPVAEIELLHSRMVISEAVNKLRLYIEVEPKYFPVVGPLIASRADGRLSEPGLFGRGGYAWGAEKAVVSRFDVPAEWENRQFVITAQGGGRFRLEGAGGQFAIEGTVGAPLVADTAAGRMVLTVDSLAARPGAQFLLRRTSQLGAIEKIQQAMSVVEQGKMSGILEATLQGRSARWVSSVLGEIGRAYMRQNQERKTADARKSLVVLDKRLAELKQQLEQAETDYKQFRERRGTVQLDEEARISLAQAAAANTHRVELLQKRKELLTRFGELHPVIVGLDEQLKAVETEAAEAAGRIKRLPTVEQDEVRLARDIKVDTDTYASLSSAAEQLRIISVSRASGVRLVDIPLVPEKPVKPNRALLVALGAATGLFLGIVAAFVRKYVYGGNGIETPEQIERIFGARVLYATIPHSDNQQALDERSRSHPHQVPLLAAVAANDAAIESLRGFRAALQFSVQKSKTNIIMFTGPTSGIGKSFACANCAAVMAAAEKKVLLLDADFRAGCLHWHFDGTRENGLYEYIAGHAGADQVIRRSVMRNLDFIPAGNPPADAGEFLQRLDLGALVDALDAGYDFVMIDLPGLLDVADVLTIGGQADAIFLLARANVTTESEIGEALKRLYLAGIGPQGILFNDFKPRPGRAASPAGRPLIGRS